MTADSVLIRQVQASDAISLHANCLSAATRAQVREQVRWAEDEAAPARLAMLVAVEDDEVIGTATLQPDPGIVARDRQGHLRLVVPEGHPGHRFALSGFVVTATRQGTGVGRALFDAIHDTARSWGASILTASCRGGTHAEQVYQRLGFREVGRIPAGLQMPDGVFDEVLFWMSIGDP